MADKGSEAEDKAADERDPIEEIEPLPTVQEIGWTVLPKPPPVERKVEVKKAAIGWRLRPWSPKPKKTMVTMSDVGMGRARTGTPARRKRRRPAEPEEDES